MCKDLGYLLRQQELRAGLQHLLQYTGDCPRATITGSAERQGEGFITLFVLVALFVHLHFDRESCSGGTKWCIQLVVGSSAIWGGIVASKL